MVEPAVGRPVQPALPPLELVVLHPDYAVVKLPMTVVDPIRGIGEEAVGAAAFIWSTVPDRGGPRDAFNQTPKE